MAVGMGIGMLGAMPAAQAGPQAESQVGSQARFCPTPLAHRGFVTPKTDPDTIPAIKLAAKYGGAELDVLLTRDDKLVVIHNAKLNKSTNGTGFVHNRTFKYISKLRTKNGARVPTFARVGKVAARKNMTIAAELKLRNQWTPETYAKARRVAKKATRQGAQIYLGGRGRGFSVDLPMYAKGALTYWVVGDGETLTKANAEALGADMAMAKMGKWTRAKVRAFKRADIVPGAQETRRAKQAKFLRLPYFVTDYPKAVGCR
jgi:glycerophosphoryl diester phosphodiesterase